MNAKSVVRVFVGVEIATGLLAMVTGTSMILFGILGELSPKLVVSGFLMMVVGFWLHVILVLYRMCTYLKAVLVEIAPALQGLMQALRGQR